MSKENAFPSLLLLIFITLKLCKVITWPWVWVLSPFWIPASIALVVIVFAMAMAQWTGQIQICGKKNKQFK